jgi:hypothetical protein
MHGAKGFLVREDRHVREYNIPRGVIEMAMRIDRHADGLAGPGLDCAAKLTGQPGILLSVDHE